MGQHSFLRRAALAGCIGMAALAAHAQDTEQATTPTRTTDAVVEPAAASKQAREIAQGDPARWYREDATRQARMRTLQKEIGAAFQEAQNACKKRPAAERSACMKEARATWQQDMAQARAQVDGEQ
ncbi:hypothetical protein B0920_09760 [Massilia sp. KIM]|uniref:hypothetical protein n=1 Tax=Massilia sp. KIM TaxID=1955422 RepID=UPI00098EEA20|nr:hypothetical protein [Massilia sp. KIM]OON63623.1 hypothetical protein B0920_09760 [Massilia sp. KIM]